MLSRAISTCTLAERLATRGTSDKEELEKVSEKLSEKVSSIGQKFNGLMSRRSRKGSGFIGLLLGNTHHGIDGRPSWEHERAGTLQEHGFGLIEVLIAMFLLMLLLVPTAYFMGSLFKLTSQSKIRTEASALTTSLGECITSLPTTDLSNNQPWVIDASMSPSQTVYSNSSAASGCAGSSAGSAVNSTVSTVNYGNFTYKLNQTTSLVTQNSSNGKTGSPSANTCYGLGGDPQLLLQTVNTAGWKQQGATSKLFGPGYSTTSQSMLLTPPQIDVLVQNLSGLPVPNTTISISGPASLTGTTGSSGCVSFVNLPVTTPDTGSYTVSASIPEVNPNGNPTGNDETLTKQATLSPAGVVQLVFPADVNVPPPAPFNGRPIITSIQALPWMQNPGSLNGAFGPITGGNQVFIFGHNFAGVSILQFGSTDASFSVLNCASDPHPNSAPCPNGENYYISATVPGYSSQTGGSVYVTATAIHNGQSYTSNQATYSYWNQPYVYSIGSPDSSSPGGTNITNPNGTPWGGTQIMINGFNFQYANLVQMCIYPTNSWTPCTNVNASFTVDSNTQITADTPTDWFACSISQVISDFNYCSGLDLVTSSLINYAALTVTATVSDAPGKSQSMTSNPDSNGSTSDCPEETPVTLGSNTSTSQSQNVTCHFLYALPPKLTALVLNSGPVSGGNTVYICGSNFHTSGPGQITQVNWGSTVIGTSGFQVITQNYSATTYPFAYNNTPCGKIALAIYPRSVTYIKVDSVPPAPGGNADTVPVSVQNAVGAVSNSLPYTYNFPPSISYITPQGGGIGGLLGGANTQVDIYGSHFGSGDTVNFGCAGNASYTVVSSTEIQATAPNAYYCNKLDWGIPQQVTLTVSNSVGTSNGVTYTYQNTPSIGYLNTANGAASGGNTIAICNDSNLQYVTSASFGGSVTTNVSQQSQGAFSSGPCGYTLTGYTYLNVVVPPSPNGGYDVVNVSIHDNYIAFTTSGSPNNCDPSWWPGGENCNSNTLTYTYNPPPPTISSVSPHGGSENGGTTVTIDGTNLDGPGFNTSVNFGCSGNASIISDSGTQLVVSSPDTYSLDGMCGNYIYPGHTTHPFQTTITVSTIGGSTSWSPWTYQNGASISSLSPSSGPTWGGNTVTINGSNLKYATYVVFNGNWISVRYNSNNGSVSVTAPPDYCGFCKVSVQVIMPSGVGNSGTLTYTYEGSPSISSISPTSVSYCNIPGTATINIYGNNFTGATSVTIGGNSVSFTVDSNTEITATDQWYQRYSGQVDVSTSVGTADGPNFNYNMNYGFC